MPPKAPASSGTKKVKIVTREAPGVVRKRRKERFRKRWMEAINDYKNILVINIDNVGSNQIQLVRLKLRDMGNLMLVGKNSVIRPLLKDAVANGNEKIEALIPFVRENVAFVFTNSENLKQIREVVCANKVPAAAKTGAIAPSDVHIPAGATPLDPGQTSFFQALQISTKITKGAIEILTNVHLIQAGNRVSASAVALLNKLGIKPFFYGITVKQVYNDGVTFDNDVLDINPNQLFASFKEGVEHIRAISLAAGLTNALTIRNSIIAAQNILLKIVVNIPEYSFSSSEDLREALGLENFPVAGAEDDEEGEKSGSGSGSGSDKSAAGSASGSASGSGSGSGSGSDSD